MRACGGLVVDRLISRKDNAKENQAISSNKKIEKKMNARKKILKIVATALSFLIMNNSFAQNQSQALYLKDMTTTDSLQITFEQDDATTMIPSELGSVSAAEGGEYILVKVKLKNVGTAPISVFDMPSIHLIDAQGHEYSTDIEASIAAAMLWGDDSKAFSDLNPDLAVSKVEAFEVSKARFNANTWLLAVGKQAYFHLVSHPSTQPSAPVQSQDSRTQNSTPSHNVVGYSVKAPFSVGNLLSKMLSNSTNTVLVLDLKDRIEKVVQPLNKGNKKSARILNDQGLKLFRSADYAGAADKFRAAVAIDPSDIEAHNNWAFSLIFLNDLSKAESMLGDVLTQAPGRPAAWKNLAEVYKRQDKIDQAAACWVLAFQFSSNKNNILNYLRGITRDTGDPMTGAATKALAMISSINYP